MTEALRLAISVLACPFAVAAGYIAAYVLAFGWWIRYSDRSAK